MSMNVSDIRPNSIGYEYDWIWYKTIAPSGRSMDAVSDYFTKLKKLNKKGMNKSNVEFVFLRKLLVEVNWERGAIQFSTFVVFALSLEIWSYHSLSKLLNLDFLGPANVNLMNNTKE